MKNRSLLLLAAITLSFATITIQIRGDIEPAEYPDRTGPEVSSTCPGVGTCSRTVTPGEFYCDSCWFIGCGCHCINADLVQTIQMADCGTFEIAGFTIPFCFGWYDVSSTLVPGVVCTSWHG